MIRQDPPLTIILLDLQSSSPPLLLILICNCNTDSTSAPILPSPFLHISSLRSRGGSGKKNLFSSNFIYTNSLQLFWENLKINSIWSLNFKFFSLTSATMQVTNFTSGKVPKLKRSLCERCSYVPCPSNVLCNFPSSKLFSALDEVSGNASLFLTYNIIHCTLQHTAISYMILLCIYMRSLMCLKNGLRKNAEVYCQLSQTRS